MRAACPLCSARKAKRLCPALGHEICPVCCATKRLTQIRCPSGCSYLSASRAHPAAIVQRQRDRDMRFLLPRIGDLSEPQYRLFMLFQAIVLQHTRQTTFVAHDEDVAEAAATLAATLETARKGIIYEHHAASIPAQRLASEIAKALNEVAGRAGAETPRLERDAAAALRCLERTARDARAEVPDPEREDSSWLALADRLMKSTSAESSDQTAGPKLVI